MCNILFSLAVGFFARSLSHFFSINCQLTRLKSEYRIFDVGCCLLNTGLSNLLNKCLQRRNSAEMLNESEERRQKLLEFLIVFLLRSLLMTINLLKRCVKFSFAFKLCLCYAIRRYLLHSAHK